MSLPFHPLANIFPLIDGASFDQLVSDIKSHGQREPIWMYEGKVLDGRNRYRACIQLGVTPRTEEFRGEDALAFVVSLNLRRRHLNPGQLSVVALDIEALEADRAKARMLAGKRVDPTANLREGSKGEAAEKAAALTGASPRNVQKAKKLNSSRPDLVKKVASGELSLNAAEKQAKDDEKKAQLVAPVKINLAPGLHHGDFRQLAQKIGDETVELVFTDPPYDGDSVHLYEAAAEVSARILKPGGSFIAYSGNRHLPEVLSACSKHLRYWWTIACVHSGGNQILQKLGIRAGWKPLVWFVKGTRGDVQEVLLDVVSGSREKQHHEWQQAEQEASYYIEKLTSQNGLVVDFFIGGGTTAVACEKLGRPWIGFEVNASSAERASDRILKVAA